MVQPDLVLEFEIEPGRSPDLANVARALLAWNDAVQAVVAAIDPGERVVVELLGVEPGSQRFKQILKRYERFSEQVEEGAADYPLIWKQTKWLAQCVAGGIIVAGITNAMAPESQTPELVDAIKDLNDTIRGDRDLTQSSQSFYEVLQNEPAISKLEVFEGDAKTPLYSVPRSEFAHRSGLFQAQDESDDIEQIKPQTGTWEVVLVKPVLVGTPRRWTFARDGIEFSALMTDKAVLQALHDRTLAIPFAEGVMMQIEVRYKVRLDGNVWLPVTGTHKVTRVLSPRVPQPPLALFAGTD